MRLGDDVKFGGYGYRLIFLVSMYHFYKNKAIKINHVHVFPEIVSEDFIFQ